MNGTANCVSSIRQGAPRTAPPHQTRMPYLPTQRLNTLDLSGVTPSPVLCLLHSTLSFCPHTAGAPSAFTDVCDHHPFSAWHGLADRKSLWVMASPVHVVGLVSRNSAERTWCWFIGVLTYSFNKHTRMMTMAPASGQAPGTSEEEEPWFLTLAQGEGLGLKWWQVAADHQNLE